MQIPRWQVIARAKVADMHSRTPDEWRLSNLDLENAKKQRTLTGPYIERYLTDDEKGIIGNDSVQLVEKIKSRQYTAVDVVRAYCKTAAVAQQIVSYSWCLPFINMSLLTPIRTTVFMKSCSTSLCTPPSVWINTTRRMALSKAHYTDYQLA